MHAPSENILEARNISLHFGSVVALDDLSITARAGELLGVIGPNGAGKTTLLNAISGACELTSGSIMFDNSEITSLQHYERVSIGISRTFQGLELFPELTVEENLLMGRHHLMKAGVLGCGTLMGWARREEINHRREIEKFVELFELGDVRASQAHALSYGRQKIVGLARALCCEPRLVLLDEIASGLNDKEKDKLAQTLRRMKEVSDVTIIWVEHDVRMICDLADNVALLDQGRLVLTVPASAALADPCVRSILLGLSG